MGPFVPQSLPIQEVKWEPLIPLIGKANRALAHYDGALYGVPNPEVLLSPLTTQEAVLSSEIEGTVATLSEVLEFEAGESPVEQARLFDIQEIINYRRAMRLAEARLKDRPFNLNLLLELHAILLDSVRGRDKGRGRFRTSQNWIGKPGCTMEPRGLCAARPAPRAARPQRVGEILHADRPDALVQLAVVHAQFEIIHPFNEGNGRMSRIIIPLFLTERGILSRPTFYLSSYLESHRDEYVGRLRLLGREPNAWNKWIEFFLRAIIAQAGENARKARAIIDLYENLKNAKYST